jgi:uncharacterized protein YbjT (DUF2867 family)
MRVLVTGGSGVLGRSVVQWLVEAGHVPRVLSRRGRAGTNDGEWAIADLATSRGLPEALAGVDVVIHAASSPFRQSRHVDVEGTRRLLRHAREAGVRHLIYPSIVGINRIPFGYYRDKLAAEDAIAASDVPWTILRATQFHELLDFALRTLDRLPVLLLPAGFQFQPVDSAEVAAALAAQVDAGPAGRLPDFGGPEILSVEEITRAWLAAEGRRKPVLSLPLPGVAARGFRQGYNTNAAAKRGRTTWAEWLRHRDPKARWYRLT